MARTENGRLAYADLLRVLACIAVVIFHIATNWQGQATGSAWTVMSTYAALMRWCLPMFVMLSGAFLLDPQKSVRLRDVFLRYILRVLAALLVWGIIYALIDYGHTGWRFTWAGVKSAFRHILWADTHYHLWFLFVMLGLYLVTPILRAFVKGAARRDFHWFFLLAFLCCCLLPVLRAIWPDWLAIPLAWLDKMDIHLVLGYVGFYVAGYYLKHYTLGRIAEFTIYILGILGAVATVWGSGVFSGSLTLTVLGLSASNSPLLGFLAPNIVFMSVAIFVLFRYVLGVSEERSRRQRFSGVAWVTFGIYLVHDLFIMLLEYLNISTLSFNPVISIPVLAAVVFLCSFAVSWLISRIPFLGHYLT